MYCHGHEGTLSAETMGTMKAPQHVVRVALASRMSTWLTRELGKGEQTSRNAQAVDEAQNTHFVWDV
jgi:hypothetical protein